REAVGGDELVIAALAVGPDAGLQGGVREPADPAEARRVYESATSGEARAPKLPGPPVEKGVDGWREGGPLDRDPPVGLDEHEQDVLAAQRGQQPAAGRAAEGIVPDLVGEDAPVGD